jgi:DNA-binding CsgD family transcriptional regulator
MRGTEAFSDLIGEIYDAAIEPSRWSDVVISINKFVGGRACGLFSKDSISKHGVTHYYCGADPYYIQLYAETHSKFDPLAKMPGFGEVVSIPDLVSFDEYRRGRFYQEWLQPQGSVDAANVVLEKSNSNCPVLLTVLSGKEMVDNDMRKRIALLVPHAYRALLINKSIEAKQSQADNLANTLDGLSAGIFFVDCNDRIVHMNAAGRDLLAEDDVLRSVNGQLLTRDTKVNHDLRKLLAFDDPEAIGSKNVAFALNAQDGERYIAHVLPLTLLAQHGDRMHSKAVAAVFVRKVELDSHSCGELIARSFKLTPAELRVLLAIVDVGGVPKAAETLGVAETTIKTHLQRVFAKTGVNGQADLTKLAAGYCNPLVN